MALRARRRFCTPKRARALEQARSEQSFRILPREGARQLIAQADGSMICTVQAGKGRAEKRPREWKEMRLGAAQVHGSARALDGTVFATVEDTGRRWGHCAREAGWGAGEPDPRARRWCRLGAAAEPGSLWKAGTLPGGFLPCQRVSGGGSRG